MKNKVLSVLLVSALAVSMLAGCGDDKKTSKDSDKKTEDDANKGDADADADENGDVRIKTVSMFGGTDPNVEAYE